MPLWRFLALVLLAVAGVVVVTIWYFPPTADFRAQNPFWNGLEDFGERFEAIPLSSLEELPQAPGGTVLVVIPYLEPNDRDLQALQAYVEGGGTLVLADDYGFGNVVLEALGVGARFSGTPLLDPLFNYRDRWFPLVTELAPSPFTHEVSSLALNYATALEGDDLTVIGRSSSFSYLDQNGNENADDGEPVGPLPTVGQVQMGEGLLVLLADPSVFINSMLKAEDNLRFLENVFQSAGPEPTVFLDQAHLPMSRLDEAKSVMATVRDFAAQPASAAGLVVIAITILLVPIWRRKGIPAWTERR